MGRLAPFIRTFKFTTEPDKEDSHGSMLFFPQKKVGEDYRQCGRAAGQWNAAGAGGIFSDDGGGLPPGGWGTAWNGAAVWFAGNLE